MSILIVTPPSACTPSVRLACLRAEDIDSALTTLHSTRAMKAIAQWFWDAWNLPWNLEGPFLALSVVVVSLLVTVNAIIAMGGGDNTTGSIG